MKLILWLTYDSLKLDALYFTNNAGLENNTSCNVNIMTCLLYMLCIEIGGKNKAVFLLKVNIKTVGTPGLFAKTGGKSKYVMFVYKINYSFLWQIAHGNALCVTKVRKKFN